MISQKKQGSKHILIGIAIVTLLPVVLLSQGIIVDHTNTDITQIPDTWINQVKSLLKIHYAHTSHGEQITEGLERLSNSNSKYAYYPDNCTVPQTTQYLSLMDGQYMYGYCETYITPDYYWEGAEAMNITRSVLNSRDVNVSLWAWCTQLDYYSRSEAQAYLDAMAQLEAEYPSVTFIYMTGNAQSAEQNRYDRNNQIRDYCRNNNKVLFDFADLDCWYNGQQHTEGGIPLQHPQFDGDQGGHTTYESCEIKAKAFWWLLARVAGWDGTGGGGGGGGGGTLPDEPPFGSFDTPLEATTVTGSIPVSGWALDDTAVTSVKIYRQSGSQKVYIGDATLVEGARPDVETAYPDYPNNSKAGWGYMMLTNFLPNEGNGTVTLYAIAEDNTGHKTTLGARTINCDNANAVKPFGAIDTPTQGGNANGSNYINWGWVLTPQPNRIPTNGNTIHVWVDGVNIGNPNYNLYRSDIATLFPGYRNTDGAVGYYNLDTTAYTNGVHIIQWTATDNANNTEGIGSRYFNIQNTQNKPVNCLRRLSEGQRGAPLGTPKSLRENRAESVRFYRGYEPNGLTETVFPGNKGMITADIEEIERIKIYLDPMLNDEKEKSEKPYQIYDYQKRTKVRSLKPLPAGSHLDSERGIFYWQPGPGFLGMHELKFIRYNEAKMNLITIRITINPLLNRQ